VSGRGVRTEKDHAEVLNDREHGGFLYTMLFQILLHGHELVINGAGGINLLLLPEPSVVEIVTGIGETSTPKRDQIRSDHELPSLLRGGLT
jgi:hypothetical protein